MSDNIEKLPELYNFTNTTTQLGCVLGCILGITQIIIGIQHITTEQHLFAILLASGILTILSSLVGLGLTQCFLTIVKSQIEIRNAVILRYQADLESRKLSTEFLLEDKKAAATKEQAADGIQW